MPINNAFVHIPRTGGTTVHDCLGKYATNRPDHEFLGKDARIKYHGYFLYTFMRNPYTRMISCYESQFPRELNHYHLPNEDDHITFDRYIEVIIEGQHDDAEHFQHWRPQTDWIFGDNEVVVNYIGHTETMGRDINEIARLISVDEIIEPLVEREYDIIPRTNRPSFIEPFKFKPTHINSSTWRYEDYKDYYNDDTRKKVEKYYERDLDFLKVKF